MRHPGARSVFGRAVLAAAWLSGLGPCRLSAEEPGTAVEAAPDADAGADDRKSRVARVPPVPDGSPAEILRFVERISDPDAVPRSRGRRRYYLKKAGAAMVEAADKILAQVAADDPLHAEAIRLKLDGFSLRDEMGDKDAMAAMAAFVRTLVDDPNPAIARQARRLTLAGDVEALYQARSAEGADALIDRAATLLASGADLPTARVAAQLAEDLARLPTAAAVATRAHETFIPALEQAEDPAIRQLAAKLAQGLRRLELLGRPLPLSGTLLDDTPFDAATTAGKVLLVDFWATWHEPCVAAIPDVRRLYEKYRAAGFEVVGVSLDEDPAAVRQFVAGNGISWPVILDDRDPEKSLAERHGIRTIPASILVGRDGKVISVWARGESLEALLEELFPDVR